MRRHGWFIALLAWIGADAWMYFWLTSPDEHRPAWTVWLCAGAIFALTAAGAVYMVQRVLRTRRDRVP